MSHLHSPAPAPGAGVHAGDLLGKSSVASLREAIFTFNGEITSLPAERVARNDIYPRRLSMNSVRPHLKMLTEEQIQEVHQYTMKLLATTGVRVDSPTALEMLKKTVGSSMVDGRTVRFPAELVEWAIKVAPRQIQMYDRRGNPQFTIGG